MSVMDLILERHGMSFILEEQRIVNRHGVTVQHGPAFDLRDSVLANQAAKGQTRAYFPKKVS